jgi:hypothetical protein
MIDLQLLHDFIVRAKSSTYIGGGKKLLPYRLGSHDLQFEDGDWAYHDSYLGESDFIGQEIVYFQGKIIWGMNYFGRILLPNLISAAQAGAVIKAGLSRMYAEGRFLGGFEYSDGVYHYTDTSSGSVEFFTGKEWISRAGTIVYELVYHGGLVKN